MEPTALSRRLLAFIDALDAHFGHEPHWWPVVTEHPRFEVIVGTVLVQQTRWEMVESAIARLRDAGLMTPATLAACDTNLLAGLIRPCAFHLQKAPGLQAICRELEQQYGGDPARLLEGERLQVRARLLALPRIGRETADTIMLYGGGWPVFIVDAYARRLFARYELIPGYDMLRAPYDDIQARIEQALATHIPDDAVEVERHFHIHRATSASHTGAFFYAQLHALLVEACVHHCLARNPRCNRQGLARRFRDPLKCSSHCLHCDGCPLRFDCVTYDQNYELCGRPGGRRA